MGDLPADGRGRELLMPESCLHWERRWFTVKWSGCWSKVKFNRSITSWCRQTYVGLYHQLKSIRKNLGLRVKGCPEIHNRWSLKGCQIGLKSLLTPRHSCTFLQVWMWLIFQGLFSDVFWHLFPCVCLFVFPSCSNLVKLRAIWFHL